ncbi:MAG TPA: DUF2442 domain-containing protein [Desulfuromonas sp.]|nr:DUF2442 domain-containing protein [Desulfuromonas sp.]
MPSIVNIVAAEQVATYALHLRFDDGAERRVDFEPFLNHSQHPDIRKFLDPKLFGGYRLEYGELVWGDYELCFPIADLYYNDLEHKLSLEAVA